MITNQYELLLMANGVYVFIQKEPERVMAWGFSESTGWAGRIEHNIN